jgi:hypothetical protein
MPSLTEIANLALAMVGDERVTSLTESSKAAQLCNAFLPQVRDAALVLHPWNFAIRRSPPLPALAVPPGFDYATALQVPADCLRVLRLDSIDPHEPWTREGDTVLCNLAAPVRLLYIGQVTDSGKWAPGFVDFAAAMLAERLALPLAASQQSRAAVAQLRDDALRRARQTDAAEGTPHPAYGPADVFVEARR